MTSAQEIADEVPVYAAFQGGGAKAVAYAGAVAAMEEAGYRFKGVAGTSAGAIVAALIAAEVGATELRSLVPSLLTKIGKPPRKPGLLTGSSLPGKFEHDDVVHLGRYSLEELRVELEDHLRRRVRGSPDGDVDVTFEELQRSTGIELNVLLARAPGVPAVLNHYATPKCQVSHAVVASCSIPFVITPQLMEVGDASERLIAIDGGVWANFPDLSFRDPSLRYYQGADEMHADDVVVGFVLDTTDEPAPGAPVMRRSRVRALVSRLARKVLPESLYLVGIGAVAAFLATIATVVGVWSIGEGTFGWNLARVALTVFLIPGVLLTAVLLKLSRYERIVKLTLPTLVGGMTSITTSVPEWVGAHPRRRVIRVPASAGVVGTMSFTLPPAAIDYLVDRAHAVVSNELSRCRLETLHPGRRTTESGARFLKLDKLVYRELSDIGKALEDLGMR